MIARHQPKVSAAVTRLPALLVLALLMSCGKPSAPAPANDVGAAMTALPKPKGPVVPKVPFSNQPCQSLTDADSQALGMSLGAGRPDRAPATLPVDNLCMWGGIHVGYMTEIDYQTNQSSPDPTPAPGDLPGAFYSRGDLWFAKNGYFVIIGGNSAPRIAAVIAAKL